MPRVAYVIVAITDTKRTDTWKKKIQNNLSEKICPKLIFLLSEFRKSTAKTLLYDFIRFEYESNLNFFLKF